MAEQLPDWRKILGLPPKVEKRVPLPKGKPNRPFGESVPDDVIDGLFGLLGINDSLSAEASKATQAGGVLGAMSPFAMLPKGGVQFFSRLRQALDKVPDAAHPNKVKQLLMQAPASERALYGLDAILAQGATKRDVADHLMGTPPEFPGGWGTRLQTKGPGEGSDYSNYSLRKSLRPDAPDIGYFGAPAHGEYRVDIFEPTHVPTGNLDARIQSHWRSRYPVAHSRSLDVTPEGPFMGESRDQRGRLIEEIQSDWHQNGRKQGYGSAAQLHHSDATASAFRAQQSSYAETMNESPASRMFQTAVPYEQPVDGSRGTSVVSKALWGMDHPMSTITNPDELFPAFMENLKDRHARALEDGGHHLSMPVVIADDVRAALGRFETDESFRYALAQYFEAYKGRVAAEAAKPILHGPYPDDWQNLLLKYHLADAVNQDKGWIGIASGDSVARSMLRATPETMAATSPDTRRRIQGMQNFYDKSLPKELQNLVSPHGGQVEVVQMFDPEMSGRFGSNKPTYPGSFSEARIVRLTPAVRDRIRKEGLPFLSVLPPAIAAQYLEEEEIKIEKSQTGVNLQGLGPGKK